MDLENINGTQCSVQRMVVGVPTIHRQSCAKKKLESFKQATGCSCCQHQQCTIQARPSRHVPLLPPLLRYLHCAELPRLIEMTQDMPAPHLLFPAAQSASTASTVTTPSEVATLAGVSPSLSAL